MKRIWAFLKKLFVRETRVELALKVAKSLKQFSDSTYDDIIVYVLNVVVPGSSAATGLVQNFLTTDLPVLLQALELIDASDESEIREENITGVCNAIKALGTIIDEDTLRAAVERSFETDNQLSLIEAKELLSNYLKS